MFVRVLMRVLVCVSCACESGSERECGYGFGRESECKRECGCEFECVSLSARIHKDATAHTGQNENVRSHESFGLA